MGVLLFFLIGLGVPLLVWLVSDWVAAYAVWAAKLNSWIWKRYDPFGDYEGLRRLFRWTFRIWALAWLALVGVSVIASSR